MKGFSIVNETEIDVFLKFPCFLYNPVNVGSLISSSSFFSKPGLDIWKFLVCIMLKHTVLYVVLSRSVMFNSLCPPLTVAHQAPLSMGFCQQDYWSGFPCPPPADLPNPRIEPRSPELQADTSPSGPPGKPWWNNIKKKSFFEIIRYLTWHKMPFKEGYLRVFCV